MHILQSVSLETYIMLLGLDAIKALTTANVSDDRVIIFIIIISNYNAYNSILFYIMHNHVIMYTFNYLTYNITNVIYNFCFENCFDKS